MYVMVVFYDWSFDIRAELIFFLICVVFLLGAYCTNSSEVGEGVPFCHILMYL